MRRNKLYTVNKWNKPAFMGDRIYQNIFDGFDLSQMARNYFDGSSAKKTFDMNIGNSMEQQYLDSKNALGISKANNPFSKYNLAQAKEGLINAGTGALATGIGMLGSAAGNAIAGGKTSKAGEVVGNLGSSVLGGVGTAIGGPIGGAVGAALGQTLGGLTNAAFGSELNEQKIADVENNNAQRAAENDALYNVESTDALFNSIGNMTNAMSFNQGDIGEDGWFASDAADKYDELKAEQDKINSLRGVAISSTTDKVNRNQFINQMKNNITAFGGKLFADGGLQSAFMDEFGSDPVGVAVRYKQGLERQAAEEEEAAINAAREAEYLTNQQRLANLETKYQGLQAIMSAMPSNNPTSSLPSDAASSSNDNQTWNYIEDQLKKSGKFNDTQIKGIKYNLQRESSINPDIVGDGGEAFGLAQWHGSRQPKDRSLEGQTKHLIETLSNFDGKEHWIGRENYEGFLNARTPEEAHYYITKGYERPHKEIVAKVKRDSDMSLRNLNAFGGELGTNGTDFTDGMIYIDEGGSHEDNPLDGVPMGIDAEGIPNLVEEGETVYNDYVFSDRMKVPTFMYKELGLGGVIKKKGQGMSFADASKKLSQESEQRPNDPISKAGLDASLSRLAEVQETERMKKNAKDYKGLAEYALGGKIGNKYALGTKDSNNPYGDGATTSVVTVKEPISNATSDTPSRYGWMLDPRINDWINDQKAQTGVPRYGIDDYKPYGTWMRYAAPAVNGSMVLSDLFGITNNPDYSEADKIESYARLAGKAPHVGYKPVYAKLRYNPMDIWFGQNRMDANARATDRAIMNNAAPIGTKMAGLLASGYNNQIANGQLYRSALEYNDAKRKDVAGFNRTTDMFNSQMGLEAAMANARYDQTAKQMGLSGLEHAAAMRDTIDQRVGAARSANLTNWLNSLTGIGRENFALNQINSDRSRRHGARANGTSYDKVTGRACGGKINRRK